MRPDYEAAGAADCKAENAAVSSTEARRRAKVREDRGNIDAADYWYGYALQAEEMEHPEDDLPPFWWESEEHGPRSTHDR